MKRNARIVAFMILCGLMVAAGLAVPVIAQEAEPTPAPDSLEGLPVDPRFGLVESFWGPDEAAELNVGWDRILFYWNEIQPTGPDDWNTLHVLEEWLVDAEAHDRRVLGLLKNTPVWATDGDPFSGVPRGLYLPVDDPDNLWAGYVRKVVEYYAPRGVHDWIVWNEPEIDTGVYGHEFSGSVTDYYQLLKVAYQVAKETDPQATIHLAGYSYWHDPTFLNRFLNVAVADPEAKENNYFFDTFSLHIYFRVETVESLLEEVWNIQRQFGIRKPIWINETNASPNLDPLWPVERPAFPIDLDQQAWYIVQAYALGFGNQAATVGVYKLLDVQLPPGGESFGIIRPDFSHRPAFDAYKTTVRYLSGFHYPVIRQQTADYYIFTFKRAEDVVRVLWSRKPFPVTLDVPALADEGLLVSATGETEPVMAEDGIYPLRLEAARCDGECLVGGPPVFLVEASDMAAAAVPTAPRAQVIAETPTTVPTVTVTPRVTNTPSPTATPLPTDTPTPTYTPTVTNTPELTATPTATATALPTATNAPGESPTPIGVAGDVSGSGSGFSSYLFLAAAIVLGGLLAFGFLRKRQ
ncbi:MAG: hypothetical protein R3C44_09580 [Chloroflexota bacterium]